MEYKDAAEIVAKGKLGKWVKIPVGIERSFIIETLLRVNYARGSGGQSALRYYERGDYIVFTDMSEATDIHPDQQRKVPVKEGA